MLKIGDFAMLSKISINMLRHYDEIELLKPAQIDKYSGYRYYEEEQLVNANRIQSLKTMGLSLTIIKQILRQYEDTESWKKYLQLQLSQKQEDLDTLQKQIIMLNTAIKSLDEKSAFTNCDIAIKEIPQRKVVSYSRTISKYEEEGQLWIELGLKTTHLNLQYTVPNYDIAIVHEDTSNGLLVEIQRSITEIHKNFEDIHFKEIQPIKVASLTFKGEYPQLYVVNADIAKWINENGYDFNGNIFNIYHISPKTENQPKK